MASRDIAFLKEAEARASRLISEARDERKLKLREAQAEVKREIEAYRAEREARLRTQQPEAAALDAKVARATGETDRCVVGGGRTPLPPSKSVIGRGGGGYWRKGFGRGGGLATGTLSLSHTQTPSSSAQGDCGVG